MKKLLTSLCLLTVLLATSQLRADSVVSPETPKDYLKNNFKQITPQEIQGNVFRMVGGEWMLITAGTPEKYNSMTAGWGGFGIWKKPVSFILVHNTRHTYEFLEKEDYYTLTFFDEKYRQALKDTFGRKSGRDIDKAKEAKLTGILCEPAGIAYAEAKLIIVCKKGFNTMTNNAEPPSPNGYRLYFGEIVSVWHRK